MTEDEQEAHSVKYNVARIVKLSSGQFALFAHFQSGEIPLLKIGTLAELESFIPTAEECLSDWEPAPTQRKEKGKIAFLDLADLGL